MGIGLRNICGHGRQLGYLEKLRKRGMPIAGFIFSGGDGLGKKTIAISFIQGFFCDSAGNNAFGCGVCAACVRIAAGSHPDFLIRQGNDEIGIAEIHELRRRLSLHSFEGSFRGVLIDNAHRLLPDAQSALLKILEEPNPKTLFFLVTSRPNLLFETVRSRLTEISFGAVSVDDLRRWQEREFPGMNSTPLVFALAEGRPGVLKNFLENPDLLEKAKTRTDQFESLLSEPLVDQFLFSEKLITGGDKAIIKDFLGFLIGRCRLKLLAANGQNGELIEKLRTLVNIYFRCETTNVNPRLLVDAALLEMRNK